MLQGSDATAGKVSWVVALAADQPHAPTCLLTSTHAVMVPADGVTLDGIALGYKKTQSHIVQPWQHAQAQIVAQGCAFADRIFLPDRTTRELLMSFAVPGLHCQTGPVCCVCWNPACDCCSLLGCCYLRPLCSRVT